MHRQSPSSSSRRLLAVAGFAAATALILTGCAGEPSPVTKAVAGAATPTTQGTSISTIKPAAGSVSGSGTVTISGSNLDEVKSVQIGGQQATVTHTSDSKVVAVVPPAANFQAGSVDVALTGKNGKAIASSDKAYDYRVATPVDKQLAYAMTYWKNYNTAEWGDLNPVGGDCANFVSQTLIARGWQMNDEWYNKNAAADWSPAWGYVPAMDSYFQANAASLGLTEYPLDQRQNIKVGDIVMFDWNDNDSLDHVQIVSAVEHVDGKIVIKMVGHNEDTDYRDLDNTITVEHPGAVGHFWSLSK
ncbi:hypothetical protein GCM10027406_37160 [Leifsonia lichenia]